MGALAGEIADPGQYNIDTAKLVRRGRRTTSSSTTTTELELLRVDGIPLRSGYIYQMQTSGLAADGATAAGIAVFRLRYALAGATATSASTALPGAWWRDQTSNTTDGPIHSFSALYVPSGDEVMSLLLTIASGNGAVAVQLLADPTFTADIWVWDMGSDPGDTGITL